MANASEELSLRTVLITGATGLLGRQVCRVFAEKGWIVRGLGNQRAKDPIVRCDLLEDGFLEAQFEDFNPTVVVHCAAERKPDQLEGRDDYAMQLNAGTTEKIGKLCERSKAWMIYLSTNYVFDGKDAPFSENAPTNPLNTYAKSKLEGEVALMKAYPNAAVLRVPLLFGPMEYLGESSVTALMETITQDSPKFDNWQQRYPTYTEDVANVLETFSAIYIDRGRSAPEEFAGIFHWQANEMQTKYTIACAVAEIVGLPADNFIRDDTPSLKSAMRPQFERMLCTRLEKVLGITDDSTKFRTDFKEALARCLQPFMGSSDKESAIPVEDLLLITLVAQCVTVK